MAPAPLHYVPYDELGPATPSVVVDGSPAPGTVLCLSHWPGIASPDAFHADLSAEMAFRYARAFDRHGGAEAVSNNHFDQDGLVGVFALAEPEEALARRDLLVEVARAGDFAVTSSRRAARVSMALAAFADPARSPLPGLGARDGYAALTATCYEETLGRLAELCDHVERARDLWADEDETLRTSIAALASGAVTVEEVPALDLAVVTVADAAPRRGGHRFGGRWVVGVARLHPMALHGATGRGALLAVHGRRYELTYRYESWVQYRSRPVRPRVDLAPLAEALNEAEAGCGTGAHWRAEPVSALTPALGLAGGPDAESGLPAGTVRSLVESHLRSAPPAWDPYRLTR